MRFDFLGRQDCPEWVLAETSLVNKMSSVKIKIIIKQIINRILFAGQSLEDANIVSRTTELAQFDIDKINKICRNQKLTPDETNRLLAILDFCIFQAAKHDVVDEVFNKDLTQMGVAIENANSITKSFAENQENLVKSLKMQSMRISSIEDINYKLSYLMSSSLTGKKMEAITEGSEDLTQ